MIYFNIFFIAFSSYFFAISEEKWSKFVNGLAVILNFMAVVVNVAMR